MSANNQSQNMNNKNSPLEYLERLALLPESASTNDTTKNIPQASATEPLIALNGLQPAQANALSQFDDLLKHNQNKRNLNNSDGTLDNHSKRVCNNSNSNSPNFKSQLNHYVPSAGQGGQMGLNLGSNQRNSNLILNESPSSSSSSTSSTSSTSSSSFNAVLPQLLGDGDELNCNTDTNDTNIIDASNFDFLDYLPELNSTTIDQTITTATSLSNININHSTVAGGKNDQIDLLDAATSAAVSAADTDLWF